ncbi:hypothetical protein ACP275_10G094700 [Erythranthe tilingii]
MKQIIFIFILLIISNTSARSLPSQQGDSPGTNHNAINIQEEDFSSLMGLEECGDKDEDCEKRRMVVEAHLDYIYTQHRRP